jgi:hypothetical protein
MLSPLGDTRIGKILPDRLIRHIEFKGQIIPLPHEVGHRAVHFFWINLFENKLPPLDSAKLTAIFNIHLK